MRLKDLEEFKELCLQGICLRGTIISKRCNLIAKQERCYKKWLDKIEKDFNKAIEKTDERWEKVKESVFKRDNNTCQIWKIMTKEERLYVLNNFIEDYRHLKDLDPAHIEPVGSNIKRKYDIDNIVTVRRYFHSLLDSLKCPVTKQNITKEKRKEWLLKALNNKIK